MLHILMVGYEKEALTLTAPAFLRIQAYTDEKIVIHTLILSGGIAQDTRIQTDRMEAYGFRGNALRRMTRALWTGFQLVRRFRGSILISAQDPFLAGLLAYKLHFVTNASYEVQEHGDFFTPAWKMLSIKNRLMTVLGKIVLSRANRIRVVSERVKEHLLALGNAEKKIYTLPVSQELTTLRAAPLRQRDPQSPFQFVIPCRWTYQKGLDLAIEACRLLKEKTNASFTLTLIGRGELENSLKEAVRTTGLEAHINFLSWLPSEELWNHADALLVPSRWEGWCRTIPEAMAAGVSIITTPVGCVGSFFRADIDGVCIAPEQPQTLCDAMEALINDPEGRERMRQAARTRTLTLATPSELREQQRREWRASFQALL